MRPSKPCWRNEAASWKPPCPAPTMTTVSCAISAGPDRRVGGATRNPPCTKRRDDGFRCAQPILRAYAVAFSSGLGLREVDDEAVHLGRHHELAGEPAVRLARGGGAFEHRILVRLHRRRLRQLILLHIDMAGRAHAGAAAF